MVNCINISLSLIRMKVHLHKTQVIILFLFLVNFSLFSQTFNEQTGSTFPEVYSGSVDWGDYDNDGNLDILICGSVSFSTIARIYRNNGDSTFTFQTDISLTGLARGTAKWGDYDNDDDLDILITGGTTNAWEYFVKVYKNEGSNDFNELTDISIPGLGNGSGSWGDYDNDGDLDILVTGIYGTYPISNAVSRIYRNIDNNTFVEQTGIELTGVENGSVDFGDYDIDGDLDILLCGNSSEGKISKLYKNNGNNTYSEHDGILLPGVDKGSVAWGDYDNDGDLDILLAGSDSTNNPIARVYKNENVEFTEYSSIVLPGVYRCSSSWADYDNDGDLDILLSGGAETEKITKIYKNNGNDTFDEQQGISLLAMNYSRVSWGDYDNDGDLDILLNGMDSDYNRITKIYRNECSTLNTIPTSPGDIQSSVNGNTVNFTWDKSVDNETPQSGLSYNIQLGIVSGGSGIRSPMADVTTGFRRIAEAGRINNNSWTIQNLSSGTYYWSVQAIDNNFAGSMFSEEGSFTINFSNSISPTEDQILLPGENGNTLTVTEAFTPESRQWKYSNFPGGPYIVDIEGENDITYTPGFTDCGTYYIVCISEWNGNYFTSNEVKISIPRFTELTGSSIIGINNGGTVWGDYNNDNYLDFIITGVTNSGNYTGIYKNNGDNSFNLQSDISLITSVSHSVDWGDYDNDGDLDILISGYGDDTRIYQNEGENIFTWQSQIQLIGLNGDALWGDFNNDGDLDIVVTGKKYGADQVITRIYLNNNLEFYEVTDTNLKGGQNIALADYNNDNYLDILLSGTDINGIQSVILYKNAGDGYFIEQYTNSFIGVENGSIAWGDYDNDGKLDILLTGENTTKGYISKVYKNDGNYQFIEQSNIVLPELELSYASWTDIDNDGDLDIALSGRKQLEGNITKIYINNSDGTFKEYHEENIPRLSDGMITWCDYDNDRDLDMLITGQDEYNDRQSKILTNNTQVINSKPSIPINLEQDIRYNSVKFNWDNANDNETSQEGLSYNVCVGTSPGTCNIVSPMTDLVTGARLIPAMGNACLNNGFYLSNLDVGTYYWRVQTIDNGYLASDFSDEKTFVIEPPFSIDFSFGFGYSKPSWGDYDDDGDLDLLFTGFFPQTGVFQNNGDNTFTEQTSFPLINVEYGSSAWGDYNNDGYLDIILSGVNDDPLIGTVTKIYKNDGNNDFTEQDEISLSAVEKSSVSWGDLDNDGDLDVLITGYNTTEGQISKIYINEGNNQFSEPDGINLTGLEQGSSDLGDYDNDGDQDILLTGSTNGMISGAISIIYRNYGDLVFSEQTDINLEGVSAGSASWGDYDNDGDLDILLSGRNINSDPVLNIYKNEGNNIFSELTTDIRKIKEGSASWGDLNNDGYLDIIISGISNNDITKVYINSNGIFSEIYSISSTNCTAWGDYDNDGDLDIIATEISDEQGYTRTLINNTNYPNLPPSAPGNLQDEMSGFDVILKWDNAIDNECPDGSLYYNVRIGTEPDTIDIIAPMSNLVNGYRFIPAIGNAQCDTFLIVKNLFPNVLYYWSVQAIDKSYTGGPWSDEESFVISVINADFSCNTVCHGEKTEFFDHTLTYGDPVTEWIWDFGDGNSSYLQNPVHTYTTADTFKVRLIAKSISFSDTVQKDVIVLPKPIAGFSADIACQGSPNNFTNTTNNNELTIYSWYWNFGDDSYSSEEEPLTHGYLNVGDYNVKLKVTAENGCADSITNVVSVGAYPIAEVTANAPLTFCEGDSVILSVPYVDTYTYNWMVGGTSITDGDSSKFIAKLTGDYFVEIVNPKGNCTTVSSDVSVTAHDAPIAPLISTEGDLEFCQGDSIILSVTDNSEYSYQWKLNGGAVGIDSSRYIAKASGIYSLTVSNTTGCSVEAVDSIDVTVYPAPTLPTVNISGSTTFCEGDSVELSVTDNTDYTYQWENNSAAITGATTNSYIARNSGIYTLKITNSSGCHIKTEAVNVDVLQTPSAPSISTDGDTEFCQGDSAILSVTNTLNNSYQWKLNGGAVGIDSSRHVAKSSGDYTLTVTNAGGCSVNSIDTVTIIVNSKPVVGDLSINGTTSFCSGDSVILSTPSVAGYSYNWRNEYGLIADATSNSYTAKSSGTYQLDVSNIHGCAVRTSPVQVTVKTAPYKPVINSLNYTEGVCPGEEMIKLYATQEVVEYNYLWYKDGEPLVYDTLSYLYLFEGGNYKLQAELNGCTKESDIFNINMPDGPEKPMIYVQGPTVWYLACSNINASAYRWYCNSNLVKGADRYYYVAGRKMGDYQVSIGNDLGCFTRSDIVTIPTGATGMDDVDPFEGLRIYPNPTSGSFTIEMDNNIFGEISIDIVTEEGKQIRNIRSEKKTGYFKLEIDLSGQSKGVYFINLKIDRYLATRKLVLE